MENIGLTVLWAVCLCISGLLLGIALVMMVQWYTKQQSQSSVQSSPSPAFPVKPGPAQPLLNQRITSWLVMTQGPNRGSSILLEQPVMRIGRDPANEIPIEHPQVSRFHARLSWENARIYIEDMGSSNGTSVNQEQIVGRRLLKNGDVIGLGIVVSMTFYQ